MIKRNLLIKIQLIVLLIFAISYSTLPSSGDMACCDPGARPTCKVECCAAIGWTSSVCVAYECELCHCASYYIDPYSGELLTDDIFLICGSVWYV